MKNRIEGSREKAGRLVRRLSQESGCGIMMAWMRVIVEMVRSSRFRATFLQILRMDWM